MREYFKPTAAAASKREVFRENHKENFGARNKQPAGLVWLMGKKAWEVSRTLEGGVGTYFCIERVRKHRYFTSKWVVGSGVG